MFPNYGVALLLLAATLTNGGIPSSVAQINAGTEAKKGLEPNGESLYPPISYDGRYVAFATVATNIVPGVTGGASNVFLYDIEARQIHLVSANQSGEPGNGESTWPSVSGNGRFISFTSIASDLVDGDNNGTKDVFVYDRITGLTLRVSVSGDGLEGNNDSYSYFPSISRDGRYIVFASQADKLVPNDTNRTWDIFVRDMVTLTTRRVSVSAENAQSNKPSLHGVISGNGRFVAFQSLADNLVPGDTNGTWDVFFRDLVTGGTVRISIGPNGREGNGPSDRAAISHDGGVIAFSSTADNLVPDDTNRTQDVFVYELESGETTRVSVSSEGLQMVSPPITTMDRKAIVSPNARFVIFRSDAENLVEGDQNKLQDIFVFDRSEKSMARVSVGRLGVEANGASVHHGVSFDGRYITFSSEANNLVLNDTNGVSDIFIFDRENGRVTRLLDD